MNEHSLPDQFCRIFIEDAVVWDIPYEAYENVRDALRRFTEGDQDALVEAPRIEGGMVAVPARRITNVVTTTRESRRQSLIWDELVEQERIELLQELDEDSW